MRMLAFWLANVSTVELCGFITLKFIYFTTVQRKKGEKNVNISTKKKQNNFFYFIFIG
jgi:hypothetical protein